MDQINGQAESLYAGRLKALRQIMEQEGVSWFLVTDKDPHQSEYVAGHFRFREYLSGFTGSNGTLLVGKEKAILWTDGRYFIQAEKELAGSGIEMYKQDTPGYPDLEAFLAQTLTNQDTLAFEGRLLSGKTGHKLEMLAKKKNARFSKDFDPASSLWKESEEGEALALTEEKLERRPKLPLHPVYKLDEKITGESVQGKLAWLREEIKKRGCVGYLTAKLDSAMYLFNIRGSDVPCNPVALSYAYVSLEEAFLFIQEKALSLETAEVLKGEGIRLVPYEKTYVFLEEYDFGGKVLCDLRDINFALLGILEEKADFCYAEDPVERKKAVKNEKELEAIRQFYLLDSAAVCRFMRWVKGAPAGLTEISAAEKMDSLRQEIEGFVGLSFPTISAYGPNGAIVHYEATKDSFSACGKDGMLLVDSGGQYRGATTDVTRTYVLGKIPQEFKKHYTLVLAGCLRLGNLKFMHGATGVNLDIIARQPLWQEGIDFKHGTGHGIGAMLNVHEGPQNISWRPKKEGKDAVLEAGMIVSDEPGVYVEGSHGIRLENICEVLQDEKTAYGDFLRMRFLTWVPFDRDGIDFDWLTERDKELLHSYHRETYEKISPLLSKDEAAWLKKETD